ncbi:MAG: formylglycine-generating enzyme family protein, partial [Planctomycetota bacterium]
YVEIEMPKKSGKSKVLTKAIAKKFLKDEDSVDLSEFTAIEDEAAVVLLEYDGELLLDGLSNVKALFSKLSGSSDGDDDDEDDDEEKAEHVGDSLRLERADSPGMKIISVDCRFCGTTYKISCRKEDYESYKRGDDLIQEALDYLTAGEREMIISQICDSCFDERFTNQDEEQAEQDEEQAEYVDDVPRPGRADPPGTINNCIGMKLVPIKAGTFMMGSPEGWDVEQQHEVTLTEDFYLGLTQVTQAQHEQVMGKNPSYYQGDKVSGRDSSEFPVEMVSWEEAVKFRKKLSSLPSERFST